MRNTHTGHPSVSHRPLNPPSALMMMHLSTGAAIFPTCARRFPTPPACLPSHHQVQPPQPLLVCPTQQDTATTTTHTYLITAAMLLACSGDSLCHSDRTLDSSRLAQKNVTSGRSEGSSSCKHASQAAGVCEKALSHALARDSSSPADPYRAQTAARRLAASFAAIQLLDAGGSCSNSDDDQGSITSAAA